MANAVTEMITSGKYTNIEKWATGLAGVENFEDVDAAGLAATHAALAERKSGFEGDNLIVTLDSSFPATLGIIGAAFRNLDP